MQQWVAKSLLVIINFQAEMVIQQGDRDGINHRSEISVSSVSCIKFVEDLNLCAVANEMEQLLLEHCL